jgi:hypothetical protein
MSEGCAEQVLRHGQTLVTGTDAVCVSVQHAVEGAAEPEIEGVGAVPRGNLVPPTLRDEQSISRFYPHTICSAGKYRSCRCGGSGCGEGGDGKHASQVCCRQTGVMG